MNDNDEPLIKAGDTVAGLFIVYRDMGYEVMAERKNAAPVTIFGPCETLSQAKQAEILLRKQFNGAKK